MDKLKIDRRVKYTKKLLRDALLDLMKQKPFGAITPTELCRVADVNRNTFYSHYTSVSDLLGEIEDELYSQIIGCIDAAFNGGLQLQLKAICEAIKENRELCEIILSEHADRSFLFKLIMSIRDMTVLEWKKSAPHMTDEQLIMYFEFASGGSVGVINNWVNGGMKTSLETIADILERTNNAVMLSFTSAN